MSGVTTIYRRDVVPRPAYLNTWERVRHRQAHWFVELFAEALGVFLYCFAGVGATAAFIVGNAIKQTGLSSILQIGFGYSIGILLAILICSSTSGGHFNPCVSIAMVVFKGFPPLKAARYILAQIFGAYIGCLLVYAQWKDLIVAAEEALEAAGLLEAIQFTPNGPAGIFGLYTLAGANLSRVFLNEFVTDTVIGITIWACLDPTNFLIPPAAIPWVISFAYGAAIWGFSAPGLAANSARDVGGRLAAMTIWGTKASGGTYAALAALTNIPAMFLGILIYEFLLTDSSRVMPAAQLEFMHGHQMHQEQRGGAAHQGPLRDRASSDAAFDSDGKVHDQEVEQSHV